MMLLLLVRGNHTELSRMISSVIFGTSGSNYNVAKLFHGTERPREGERKPQANNIQPNGQELNLHGPVIQQWRLK